MAGRLTGTSSRTSTSAHRAYCARREIRFRKSQPQQQDRQDQHGRCQQDLFHVLSPPAFSKMADSSAMSASVSWRLSTMALIIRPRLPP